MDKMADVLGRAGAWCGQNKYLSAIDVYKRQELGKYDKNDKGIYYTNGNYEAFLLSLFFFNTFTSWVETNH